MSKGYFFNEVKVLRENLLYKMLNLKSYNLLQNIFGKVTKIRKIGQD